MIALLSLRFFFVFTTVPAFNPGDKVTLRATLLAEPMQKGSVQQFSANSIRIITPTFPAYHYGDQLIISGAVVAGNSSKKESVLGKIQPDFVMFFPKIELEKSDAPYALAVVSSVRQHVLSIVAQTLPFSSAALFSGIVLGGSVDFPGDFLDALRNTGTLHVVAASGMNVSLLASFVMAVFLRVVRRPIAASLVVFAIVLYAFLALLQPSIVRAAIMGGIAFGASTLNRQTFALWSLIVAAYLMLLVDPTVLFDIGFQLSFVATGGLVFLKPLIEDVWGWFRAVGKVAVAGDSFTTTVIAQLATLPILLTNFGTVSIVSVVVNTLILWVVQPIMALGIVAAILSIVPILPTIPIIAALPLLGFFETAVRVFNRPEFLIHVKLPFLAAVGYYFLLIGGYLILNSKVKNTSQNSKIN